VATRNRVALWALCSGALLAIATWQLVGRWPALIVGIVAVLAASVAYRIEPPRMPLQDDEAAGVRPSLGAAERPIDQ
jgi:hypothetical protein